MSFSPGPALLFKGTELQILSIKDLPEPWTLLCCLGTVTAWLLPFPPGIHLWIWPNIPSPGPLATLL